MDVTDRVLTLLDPGLIKEGRVEMAATGYHLAIILQYRPHNII
jgi:hypothetical protein